MIKISVKALAVAAVLAASVHASAGCVAIAYDVSTGHWGTTGQQSYYDSSQALNMAMGECAARGGTDCYNAQNSKTICEGAIAIAKGNGHWHISSESYYGYRIRQYAVDEAVSLAVSACNAAARGDVCTVQSTVASY